MWSGDPWARARRATKEMDKHLAAIARLADERALAVRELLDGGLTRAEVALMLERRHPDGLITPPTIAIANSRMRYWVEAGA